MAVRLLAALSCAVLVGAGPGAQSRAPGLPDALSASEFRDLSVGLSEPDASFISDNLVSNEMSYAQVVPQLAAAVAPDGVYLGVGPEQNFTFVAATRPRLAFIIDIRRDNLLLHFWYKALFELSPDRCTFVSSVFIRRAACPDGEPSAAALMTAVEAAPAGDEAGYRRVVAAIRGELVDRQRLPLSAADLVTIERIHAAFRRHGPSIAYATEQLAGQPVRATYGRLMSQTDLAGRELGYLASEESYRFVRGMQRRNLIIPVVGNFAGPTSLRAIGDYLRARGAVVSAFYVSNVEDYLGLELVPANGEWRAFCANVATMPLDERSVFVRPAGMAAVLPGRQVALSPSIQLAAERETVVVDGGPAFEFPPALSPIAAEVRDCAR